MPFPRLNLSPEMLQPFASPVNVTVEGWKSKKTVLAEGQRLHYNFVKPHASLNGKTPAQAAKVEVKAESLDCWMNLLKPALKWKHDHWDTGSV